MSFVVQKSMETELLPDFQALHYSAHHGSLIQKSNPSTLPLLKMKGVPSKMLSPAISKSPDAPPNPFAFPAGFGKLAGVRHNDFHGRFG